MRTIKIFVTGLILCALGTMSYSQQPVKRELSIIKDSLNTGGLQEWFHDGKFGMFIHWGPYSELAGEWNSRKVSVGENAEWIMKDLKIPVENYREMAHKLNPVHFDARQWVRLAKATGMKYIVITAKHHDGFAMYHSKVTNYNIYDWTSFKRDPLKELSEACAEEGIKFCIYYSHREDWDHPGGYGNNWDYDNDWGDDFYNKEKFEKYLEEKAKPQVKELLTNYGPVGLVWFDRGMYTPQQGKAFVKLVKDIQPLALVNSRIGNYSQELIADYQSMSDNGMPPGGLKEYWESPQTLNSTWGYSKFDTNWKRPEKVIENIVRIVSSGGNYLLNIGPKGNGEVPQATVNILEKVGLWIGRNAESIYGSTASPFGELPWGYCTAKKNKLFLFVRDWPKDRLLTLPRFNNKISGAWLLVDKSTQLKSVQEGKNLNIQLPSKPADDPITVVVLEITGDPIVDPPIAKPDSSGAFKLNYLNAVTHGNTMTRFNRKGEFHISKWKGPEDSVEWTVEVEKAGPYQLSINYGAKKEWEGKPFEIKIASSSFNMKVVYTGDWFDYRQFPAGYIPNLNPGTYKVTVRPLQSGNDYLMWLQSVQLGPVKSIKKEGWGIN